jgi:lipopolysaccharide export LptBFGC system permease protein LptF
MAISGTLNVSQPSGCGWWSECTLTAAFAVTGTSTATMTINYSNASARVFQPSLPLAMTVLNPFTATSAALVAYSTLQNGTNSVAAQAGGASQGIGVAAVLLGVTAQSTATTTGLISYTETGTLTAVLVNAGATGTLTAGTRLLFIQNQGN